MVSETSWQTAWMRSKGQPLLCVTDVLGAKPEPWQAEALEAVGHHDRVSRDDRTALAKRQKNKLLERVKSWNNVDLMATAGKVRAEYDATAYDLRPSDIMIDTIGLGAGVYDRCKELHFPVRGVNVGEAAASREKCARLRDELWFKGRESFQDRACSMPKDDALIAELTAPTYALPRQVRCSWRVRPT
jgi:hypothetical protein